jgi:hypothetical protein
MAQGFKPAKAASAQQQQKRKQTSSVAKKAIQPKKGGKYPSLRHADGLPLLLVRVAWSSQFLLLLLLYYSPARVCPPKKAPAIAMATKKRQQNASVVGHMEQEMIGRAAGGGPLKVLKAAKKDEDEKDKDKGKGKK